MRALQANRDVRVLICDDNPVQRASLVECLSEQMGLQVVCAVSDGWKPFGAFGSCSRTWLFVIWS